MQQVVAEADIIFVAVKPQYVTTVLKEARDALNAGDKLIVSIAAGVTVPTMEVLVAPTL